MATPPSFQAYGPVLIRAPILPLGAAASKTASVVDTQASRIGNADPTPSQLLAAGIEIASPGLMSRTRAAPEILAKYVKRAGTRTSAFGYFTAFTVGRIDEQTLLTGTQTRFQPMCKPKRLLSEESDLVRVNSTVYLHDKEWRFYRAVQDETQDGRCEYELASMEVVCPLDSLRCLCADGVRPSDLAESLAKLLEQSADDCGDWIQFAISEGLLEHVGSRTKLVWSAEDRSSISSGSGSHNDDHWLTRRCAEDLSLSQSLVQAVGDAICCLEKCFPPSDSFGADLEDRFRKRFGHAGVPLMHALDPDDGLWPTSSSPLRDCYPALALLGRTEEGEKVADIAFEERDEVDLETLPSRHSGSANFTRPALLTAAFSVLTTMGATSTQPTVVLRGIDSGGGLGLLGRAALGDELLLEALRDIEAGQSTRRQHRVVRAEVVHAPTVKSEWIGVRPSLLAHEIHLFAQGTALGEHRIECADLELRMADGRLVLWSTRLDCEIEPVQSSPVAYAWAHLPVYKFLCEFQRYKHSVSRIPELIKAASWKHSDDPALPFRWRRAPALRWRNVILRPQEWEIQALAPIDRSRARDQVIATLRVVGLPDRICTEVEVEQREFDLTQGEEIEEFVRALSKRKPMRVTKSLWAIPDASPLTFDGQPYANEFIVPLRRVLDDARAEGRRKCTAFHVYVSAHRANEVLGAVERRLAQPGISSHVRGWFYTRMADPFHHLRIRMLHSSGDPHVVEVLASAFSSELAGVGAWKVASAPYEHEHERYGGPELEDAVTNIFALHTACIRRIPAAGELSAAEALLAGAAITCTVLGQFELIELDLRNEAARLREWALELVHDKSAALNLLSILHREHGSAWYAAYETNHEAGSMWYTVRQAFSAAAAASRELAHRMSEVLGCDELSHIAGRLAHMCLNRYFEDDHVVHELASHDLLVRCLRRASHESTPAFEARLLEEIR